MLESGALVDAGVSARKINQVLITVNDLVCMANA